MRLLDRYSILDRIGSGGMATIYRATDDRLDRVVCVKLLRTTLVEGSGSTSGSRAVYEATYTHFLKEALALSKLSHPNTLRIYDFGYLKDVDGGTAQGAPFHVSEYLDGGNLESHVRLRGPLPTQEALGILDGICGAVAEAHEHGIIHRDIKPSNILFARVRGELVSKLADFGIAHSDVKKNPEATADDGFGESVSTVALFSPRWAAPEQLCGSPEGPRTDVYALGLLTIFMLTGTVFFGDEDVRVTFNDRVRSDTLVNARLAKLGMAGDVARVLTHALVARPDDRIATAPDFVQHIREALKARTTDNVAPYPVEVVARPAEMPVIAAPGQLALEIEASGSAGGARPVVQPPPERVVAQGERRLRYVQVHEKLDLSFLDPTGGQVRFRVTMLPGQNTSVNVKGLSCFVARRGGRPTPALTANQDSFVDLVSSGRQVLGEVSVSFGQPTANGRVFVVDGRQLLITYAEAQQVVVLMLSRGNDIVVMCRS
ncbi:MAG: serine/threonine protein kinase [Labilithrix sp.]|nr:serine/threonine protein kinase [Labilithrix sp.]